LQVYRTSHEGDFTYKDESTAASSNVENNKKEEGAPVVSVNVTLLLLQVNWAEIADEQDMNHRHQEPNKPAVSVEPSSLRVWTGG
jgi:hypothetical protein